MIKTSKRKGNKMYTGKSEFKEKFNILHLKMSFINISKGEMYYRGMDDVGNFYYIYCSMNNTKDMYYNSEHTIEDLLKSDNIGIHVNEECVLMVK